MNVGVYLVIGTAVALAAAALAWAMGYGLLIVIVAYVTGGVMATLVMAAIAFLLTRRKEVEKPADANGRQAKRPSRAGRQAPS